MRSRISQISIIYFTTLLYVAASGSILGFFLRNIYVDICICVLEISFIIISSQNISIYSSLKILFLFFSIFIVIQLVVHYSSFFYALRFSIMSIMCVLFLNAVHDQKISILHCLERVIRSLTIVNLILYLFCSILNIIPPLNIIDSGMFEGYLNYYYIYYKNPVAHIILGEITITRNSGIFWEPGVWQIYLNLALLIYLLKEGEKKKGVIALYIIAVMTTFSTTGWILLFGIIVYGGFVYRKSKTKRFIALFLGIAATFASALLLIDKSINYKASLDYRMLDFVNSFRIIKQHLLVGIGLNNDLPFMAYSDGRGNTNGVLSWICQTGLVGAVFLIIPIVRNIYKYKNMSDIFLVLFISTILFLVNMSEPVFTFAFNIATISFFYSKCV